MFVFVPSSRSIIGTPFLVAWLALLVSISSQTGWKALYELKPEAVAAILNPSHSEAPTQLAGNDQGIEHIVEPHSGPHTNAHTDSSSFQAFPHQHTSWATEPAAGLYGMHVHSTWSAHSGIDQSEIPDVTNHGRYLQPAASRPPTDLFSQVHSSPSLGPKLAEAPSWSDPRPRPYTAIRLTDRIMGEIPPDPLSSEQRREILQSVVDTLKALARKTIFVPLPYPVQGPLPNNLVQAIYPSGRRRFYQLNRSTLLSCPVALSGPNVGVPVGQDPFKLFYVWKILGVTGKDAHIYRFIGSVKTKAMSRTVMKRLQSIEGMRGALVRPFGEDSVIDSSELTIPDKMFPRRMY